MTNWPWLIIKTAVTNYLILQYDFVSLTVQLKNSLLMAVPFTVTKKNIPSQPSPMIAYYPRVAKSGVLDLDDLSERVSGSCSVTQSDCYAVVIGLVNEIAIALDQGNIVRLGHLGSFQISVKSKPSTSPEEVDASKIKSSSILFRPGKKLKTMLKKLVFKKSIKN